MLGKLKNKFANWLLKDVHLDKIHIGEHSIVISGTGANLDGQKIENVGVPDSDDDAPRRDTIDSKIATHKADASAHHTKYTHPTTGTCPQDPKSHGADKHTDVTRELFVPPSTMYTGTPELCGLHPTMALADGATEYATFELKVPDDFVSFIRVDLVWVGITGEVDDDWRAYADFYYCAHGEAYNIHTETKMQNLNVTALNITYVTDTTLVLNNLAIGDFLGGKVGRFGADGADTYTGKIRLLGIVFVYTAEQ